MENQKSPLVKVFEHYFNVQFTTCESSNIEAYAYYADGVHTDILILFKNGVCYRYLGAGHLFKSLDHANSKGKWVNENLVKGGFNIKKYKYEK